MNRPSKALLVSGAVLALTISVIHSTAFRPDFWSPAGLAAWYLLSILIGGAASLVVGVLLSLSPIRIPSLMTYVIGAGFVLMAYYFQVYALLIVLFQWVSWE